MGFTIKHFPHLHGALYRRKKEAPGRNRGLNQLLLIMLLYQESLPQSADSSANFL